MVGGNVSVAFKKIFRKVKRYSEISRIRQAIQTGWAIYRGKITKYPDSVSKFEKDFSQYIGTKYGLSFCNGTTSLDSALFALNFPKGSKVLLSGMTFQSTVMTLLQNGLDLQFVDVDKDLNTNIREEDITDDTVAILISHLFGFPQYCEHVLALAEKYNLKVIEDCSHAHGAELNGKKVGSLGDIGFFSLQGDKAVAGGEGGIATTDNKELYDQMRLYAHMGRDMSDIYMDGNEFFKKIGYGRKGRMHPVAAVLAGIDFARLGSRNKIIRKKVREFYKKIENIPHVQIINPVEGAICGGFHYGIPFWVEGSARDELPKKVLSELKINIRPYPYVQYHQKPMFSSSKLFQETIRVSSGGNNSLQLEQSQEQKSLKIIEKAESDLYFLDIDSLLLMGAKDLEKFKNLLQSGEGG